MTQRLTLLGFTYPGPAAALRQALSRIPGPPVQIVPAGQGAQAIACIAQAASGGMLAWQSRVALLKQLSCVQRRLELACQTAPFLPADPAMAPCPAKTLPALLADAAPGIARAIAAFGGLVQWDVVLRWQAEDVLRAQRTELATLGGREALAEGVQRHLAQARALRAQALEMVLAPASFARIALEGEECACGFSVLVSRNAEAGLEATLHRFPAALGQGIAADLRGPLPPLSFASVKLRADCTAPAQAAWRSLELPEQLDHAVLQRHWHNRARQLHPDAGGTDQAAMAAAGDHLRLLRGLLEDAGGQLCRAQLASAAGLKLVMPDLSLAPSAPEEAA